MTNMAPGSRGIHLAQKIGHAKEEDEAHGWAIVGDAL